MTSEKESLHLEHLVQEPSFVNHQSQNLDFGDQSLAAEKFPQAETYFRKALDQVQNSSTVHDRRLIQQKIGLACLEQGKYDDTQVCTVLKESSTT